jgi:large subunit ribosomal protein L25
MSTHEISAQLRESGGKGAARKLRAAGQVPAVLYGNGVEATGLAVSPMDIELLRRQPLGMNTPVTLNVDGLAGKSLVMIKDVQRHPLTRALLHVDFWHIDVDTPIIVTVKVTTEGRSKGEETGGRVQMLRRAIDVRCKCGDIPESLCVDLSPLDTGSKLYVDELATPDGVEVVFEQRFPVLQISIKGMKAIEEEVEGDEEDEEGEEGEEAEGEEAAPEE